MLIKKKKLTIIKHKNDILFQWWPKTLIKLMTNKNVIKCLINIRTIRH